MCIRDRITTSCVAQKPEAGIDREDDIRKKKVSFFFDIPRFLLILVQLNTFSEGLQAIVPKYWEISRNKFVFAERHFSQGHWHPLAAKRNLPPPLKMNISVKLNSSVEGTLPQLPRLWTHFTTFETFEIV